MFDRLYSSQPDLAHLPYNFTDQYSLKDSLDKFTSSFNSKYNSRSHLNNGQDISSKNGYRSNSMRNVNDDRPSYLCAVGETNERRGGNGRGQFCSRCGDGLSPLVKRKAQCVICMQWICKPCALWEPKNEGYICEQHVDEEGYR